IANEMEDERERRLMRAMTSSDSLPVRQLVDHWRAMKIISGTIHEALMRVEMRREEIRERLKKDHRIRSYSEDWILGSVAAEIREEQEALDRVPGAISRKLKDEGLLLSAYLFDKNAEWNRTQLPAIREELGRILVPKYEFKLIRYYWSPS